MRYSLIKRHLWNLKKRMMDYPIVLKKMIILVPSWSSAFYFSKTFTWSYSWKILEVLLKCPLFFWEGNKVLTFERVSWFCFWTGGHDQNNGVSSETWSRGPISKVVKLKDPTSKYSHCVLTGTGFTQCYSCFPLLLGIFFFFFK